MSNNDLLGVMNFPEGLKRDCYAFKPFKLRQHVPKNCPIPKGRSGHRIASDNACIYSFGGFNPYLSPHERLVRNTDEVKLFKELWKFNVAKGEWKKLDHFSNSLPKELASNAIIMNGSSLIIHGGTGIPFGYVSTNKTYIADLKHSNSLTLLPTVGKLPSPQYGQAMVLYKHYLYVFGGTTGFEYSANVHCLDLKTKIWEEKYIAKGISNLEPKGRYRHEVALYNSRIIVFGGGTNRFIFGFEHLPAFNIDTGEWEDIVTLGDIRNDGKMNASSFPPPRRCHGCVQIPEDDKQDPEIVICGGYDGVNMFSDIWKLNLRTHRWRKCDVNLIRPLYFHSACLSPNGQMFIFGGICETEDESGRYSVRTNEIYSMWVVLPKLKELCWEAILYYNQNITKCPVSELLNNGVPKEFVERIIS